MRAVILSCPHLKRDLRPILARIPGAEILLGEKTPKGEDGCLEMHKSVVRSAQAAGDPSVFVMEDDCQFTAAFDYARWLDDAAWAEAHGYDVLAGGCVKTYHPKPVRAGLIEVSAFHSAHCLVYSASGYAKVLRAVQPFDLSLGSRVASKFVTTYVGCRIALTFPFVAVQRPAYSGILRKPVDYVPEYVAHERELGRVLRLPVPA